MPRDRVWRAAPALALLVLAVVVACAPVAPAPSSTPDASRTEQPRRAVDADGARGRDDATAETDRAPVAPTVPTPVPRPGLRQDVYVSGLALPVAFEFAPDGRLFVNELGGQVRLVEGGVVRPEPVVTVPTTKGLEQGALGLALDPDFARNRHLYVFYSEPREGTNEPRRNRLVRFTEIDGRGADRQVILDNLPIGKPSPENLNGDHNGGRIGFGPDGKLYVTVGDVAQSSSVRKLESPHGKLLRLNSDGSVPADNPYPKRPVFATGLRSPFGLDFHPVTGLPWVSDNGPRGHDEINAIVPRGDYGWPDRAGREVVRRASGSDRPPLDPVWDSGSQRLGPTGVAFYTGSLMPEFRDDLFFCDWNSGSLWRLQLAPPNYDAAGQPEVVTQPCRLYVRTGPDGALYFSDHHAIYRLGPS